MTVFHFDACELDTERRELRVGEQVLEVQPRVLGLLEHLLRHAGRVVGRDELARAVWGVESLAAPVVAQAVMKARRAIGDDPQQPQRLRTVARIGYRFDGAVVVSDTAAVLPAALPTGVTTYRQSIAATAADPFWLQQYARAAELDAAGMAQAALDLLDEAMPHLGHHLEALLLLARLQRQAGKLDASVANAHRVADEARAAGEADLELRAAAELGNSLYRDARFAEARACCERGLQRLREAPALQRHASALLVVLANVARELGQGPVSVQCAERAVSTGLASGSARDEALARAVLGVNLMSMGLSHRAKELLDGCARTGRERGLVVVEAIAFYGLSLLHNQRCRFRLAVDFARRCSALAASIGHAFVQDYGRSAEYWGLLKLGRTAEVLAALAERPPQRARSPINRWRLEFVQMAALWRGGRGDESMVAGRALLAEIGPLRHRLMAPTAIELAFGAMAQGRVDDAEALLQDLPASHVALRVERCVAALELARGRRHDCLQRHEGLWARLPIDEEDGLQLGVDLGWMWLEDGRLDELDLLLGQVGELADDHLPARLLRAAFVALTQPRPESAAAWAAALADAPALDRQAPALKAPAWIEQVRAGQAPRLAHLLSRAVW